VIEQMHKKKISCCKEELRKVKLQLIEVQEKLEDKLAKLDAELSADNDLVVAQKSKCLKLIQKQRDEAKTPVFYSCMLIELLDLVKIFAPRDVLPST
jgi:Zn-dependent M16 (insulinase) family peptidase